MINFRFNDRADIEANISNCYVNQDNPEETIRELARYNYHVAGMNKEDNYDAILAYMTENCKDFYEEKYFKIIYRNVASAKKYKFRNIGPVVITRSEMDRIESLNDIRKEKIAFVLLAIAKYYNNISENNNNRMYVSISDIFKLARVSIPSKERASYLYFAYQEGILSEHLMVGTNLKIVSFVDNESEPVMELGEDDYKELAYAYLNYKCGGYKHCKKCGRLFKMHKSSPGRLYCKECGEKTDANEFKIIQCVDCGADVIVGKFDTETCRCEECKSVYLKKLRSEQNKRYYQNKKISMSP